MKLTEEQFNRIEEILRKNDVYTSKRSTFDEEKEDYVEDMSKIYVDGEISFDLFIKIGNMLSHKSKS